MFRHFLLAVLVGLTLGFKPDELSFGHRKITVDVLNKLNFCDDAVETVRKANKNVDSLIGTFWNPIAHCDDEQIQNCHDRILSLATQVKQNAEAAAAIDGGDAGTMSASARQSAQESLGMALHTLQDFYAHSTWVNLNNGAPHPCFGSPSCATVTNLAGPNDATCASNYRDVLVGSKLTTGYFSLTSCTSPEIPQGKCRHGLDPPWGFFCQGINKDDPTKARWSDAEMVADSATTQFVNAILNSVSADAADQLKGGDCGKRLQFVIDTTGSMSMEIDAVKQTVLNLLPADEQEVKQYWLTTFNDPDCGETSAFFDRTSFITAVNALTADGGGDCPEMMFCGILAAANAVSGGGSYTMYVFSDADAKDTELLNQVLSEVTTKNIEVNFILSGTCDGSFSLTSNSTQQQQTSTKISSPQEQQRQKQRNQRPRTKLLSNVVSSEDAITQIATGSGGLVLMHGQDSLDLLLSLKLQTNLTTLFQLNGDIPGTFLGISSCINLSVPLDSMTSQVTMLISNPSGYIGATLYSPSKVIIGSSDSTVLWNNTNPWNVTQTTGAIVFREYTSALLETGDYLVSICSSSYFDQPFLFQATASSAYGAVSFTFQDALSAEALLWVREINMTDIDGQPVVDRQYPGFSGVIRGDSSTLSEVTIRFMDSNSSEYLSEPLITQLEDIGNGKMEISLPSGKMLAPIPPNPFSIMATFTSKTGTLMQRQFPLFFIPTTLEVNPAGALSTAVSLIEQGSSVVFTVTNRGSDYLIVNVQATSVDPDVILPPNLTISFLTLSPHSQFNVTVPLLPNMSAIVGAMSKVIMRAVDDSQANNANQAEVTVQLASALCGAPICSGHGVCQVQGSMSSCVCIGPYTGTNCEKGLIPVESGSSSCSKNPHCWGPAVGVFLILIFGGLAGVIYWYFKIHKNSKSQATVADVNFTTTQPTNPEQTEPRNVEP